MVGAINKPNLKAAHLGGFFCSPKLYSYVNLLRKSKTKNEIVVIRNRISYIPKNIEKKKGNLMKVPKMLQKRND